ncbi:MAG TPA: mechanosensitive ion channel family protein [Kofleriaceae bacterium]|nr:mechanosensitive ion channel family protein [Kofleriaceae bacterium]
MANIPESFLNRPVTALGEGFSRNTVKDCLVAVGIAVAIIAGVWIAKKLIIWRVKKLAEHTSTHIDDTVIDLLGSTKAWVVLAVAVLAGAAVLTLPPAVEGILPPVAMTAVFVQIGKWMTAVIRSVADHYRNDKIKEGDTSSLGSITLLSASARFVAWIVVALLILGNFGVDITGLVAGLGIGGLAIALALQSILGDLFSSVSIMLDKPFQVGDFIMVDDYMGTVQNIGIKTTRIQSLTGEELIFANTDLTKARIKNLQRQQERRVVFGIGVTYDTSPEDLERVRDILRDAVTAEDKVRFDRAHFSSFGDSALKFEAVYYVTEPDYGLYMDIQQRINLAIYRRLAEIGVGMAFPTQTIHLAPAAKEAA